ncbi:MAG: tetratricopeptide repeat protein [Leptospiraceae bacterium]|nr:tetratricopeptide repeat protein [Leptospiraceae bacterium]MCP5495348.1 tetratricopeptide repeat protein [Leptospiraceae bacterium]
MLQNLFVLSIFLVVSLNLFSQDQEVLKKANVLRNSEKYDEALNYLLGSGLAHENQVKAFIARLHLDKKEYLDAINIYNRTCFALNTHDCWNEFGVACVSIGKYSDAIENFKKAIQVNNDSPIAHSNLAQAYFYLKKMKKAKEHHLKAIEISPSNPIVNINYAIFLIKNKRITEGKNILKQITFANSSMFYAELYLGIAHYLKKEYNTALIHFNKGIEINPDYYDLYYHRALIYYKWGDYGKALSDLKMTEKLDPLNKKAGNLIKIIKKEIKI